MVKVHRLQGAWDWWLPELFSEHKPLSVYSSRMWDTLVSWGLIDTPILDTPATIAPRAVFWTLDEGNSTISMPFSSAEAREPHENAGSCLNIKTLNKNLESVLNVSVWNTKKLLLHVVVHKEQGRVLVSWISSLIPQNRNWLRQFLCFLTVACYVAPFKFIRAHF